MVKGVFEQTEHGTSRSKLKTRKAERYGYGDGDENRDGDGDGGGRDGMKKEEKLSLRKL